MARSIQIKIQGDSSGLKKSFSEAEKDAEGFGSKIGSVFGGIAKAGAGLALGGVAAAVPLIASSVKAASDFNESLSKTNVLFGESSKLIVAWADDAAQTMGLSRQQALDAAGGFATFGKSMGLSGDDLADFAKKATGLGVDLDSFFNSETAGEGAEALAAALRGESEPIRRFGVMLNEDTLKAVALSKGLVSASVDTKKFGAAQETAEKAARKTAKALKEHGANSVEYTDAVRDQQQAEEGLAEVMEGKVPQLSQAQKMQAAYLAILDQTTDAQGDFERTADGLANKQRSVNAEFANARQELGSAFLPAAMAVADFLLQKVVPALRDVNRWVQDVANTVRTSGWGAAFHQVVDDVSAVVGSLATRAWDFLSANLPTWLSNFQGWFSTTAGPWLLDRATDLGLKLASLVDRGWEYLKDKLPTWLTAFGSWFDNTALPWLQDKAEGLAHKLADWVPQAIEWLKDKLNEYLHALQDWFQGDANPTAEQGGESMGVHIAKGLSKAWYYSYVELARYKANFVGWVTTDLTPAVVKAFVELWPEVMKTMADAARDLFWAGMDIGKNIISGIITGLWAKAQELAATVKAVIWNNVPAFAQKILTISSPSKVMMGIGEQIAEGLAVGIANGADQVAKSTQLLAQTAQAGDWPILSGKGKGSSPTITHNADGTVMFGGDPNTYPGSVAMGGAVGKATRRNVVPIGLGGEDDSGGYSLSTSSLGGGGIGTFNLTLNGVIIGDKRELGAYLTSVLDQYARARL